MTILNEIKDKFAYGGRNKYQKVKNSEKDHFWVFRRDDYYGVGLEVQHDLSFSERFATACLHTETVSFVEVGELRLLMLTNSEENLRNEFAVVCAHFVDSGEDGKLREEIVQSPELWWERWRSLLGNSVREKTTHGVLGELFVYLHLLKAGIKPVLWKASQKSSHDIETENTDYEVKSTIARYGAAVTISGQYQLECSQGKTLKLVFCRFEKIDFDGISIDTVLKDCINWGADETFLEKELARLGFENGCMARLEQFVVHDAIRVYFVDDNFPKVTGASFAEGKLPDAVIQLTYQIDLTSMHSVTLTDYLQSLISGPSPR